MLVESCDDFIAMASPDRKIIYLNEGGSRLLGFDHPREAIGVNISRLHTEQAWAKLQKEVIPASLKTGHWHGEIELRHWKTGARIDALINAFLIRRPETGDVVCLATIMRDISERKRAEKELLAAKEAAECANRLKSEFLANMSHEIRTPMNGILGMLDVTLERDLDEELRDYLETARACSTALLVILSDILNFSKIEAGRTELEETALSVAAVVHEAVSTLTVVAEKKGLDLRNEISPDMPLVLLGDPTRLRQVLVNLVNNAIKFTEARRYRGAGGFVQRVEAK